MKPLDSMLRLFSFITIVGNAAGLAATASTSSALPGLKLTRASDAKNVVLKNLWRQRTPFGIADETAVFAFLRHYG